MSDVTLLTLDLLGIAAFALSGAIVAVRKSLDIFGVIVLASITGLGGGVARDVLIGAVPPTSLTDWRYLVVPAIAGLLGFFFHPTVGRMERQISVLDAMGLGMFCVVGAVKASDYGLGILPATLIGMITAVGGGILRDVLAGRVPVIFREELYATPAFAGALIAVLVHESGAHEGWYAVALVVSIAWRILAIKRGWVAPLPPGVDRF